MIDVVGLGINEPLFHQQNVNPTTYRPTNQYLQRRYTTHNPLSALSLAWIKYKYLIAQSRELKVFFTRFCRQSRPVIPTSLSVMTSIKKVLITSSNAYAIAWIGLRHIPSGRIRFCSVAMVPFR